LILKPGVLETRTSTVRGKGPSEPPHFLGT
jgi:hypothetical protein